MAKEDEGSFAGRLADVVHRLLCKVESDTYTSLLFPVSVGHGFFALCHCLDRHVWE